MELEDLINQGHEMLEEPWDSGAIDLWKADVMEAIQPYGTGATNAMEGAIQSAMVIGDDYENNQYKNEAINRGIHLLQRLKNRKIPIIHTDNIEAATQASLKRIFEKSNVTINNNGSLSFGDNSPVNQINIQQVMTAVLQQVEQLPESPEKASLVETIKAIITNPTFAAIAGSSLGVLLSKFIGSK